ncbi:MAG: FAD-binding oxidoreductase [Eubacteriales bacterium]|nr:FAD-binding oxidoreductase [Christensenellaceae bacterium]MEA5066727.1 FAD-binding oxidoreductase [Eubacteriales bacterium]
MTFRKLTTEDVDFLIGVTAKDRVLTGENIHSDYCRDEMPLYGVHAPEVAVEVVSMREVADILRYANAQGLPVTPRGSGTGLCGACVPVLGGILLVFSRMNRILSVDADTLSVTVEPGVLLMQLAEHLEKQGLFYPPDPGEKSATIGGNLMTNAGGMRAVRYGVTRDYIKGLEVVLSDGEVLELGGDTVKSSSGYSLLQLMAGSEGTLGIVTRLTLKVIPMPKRFVSLLVPFDDIGDCMPCVKQLLHIPAIPVTLEYAEREVLDEAEKYLGKGFPHTSSGAYLIVSYHANSDVEIRKMVEDAAEICLAAGAQDVFISDTQDRQDRIWTARGAFLEAISASTPVMDECDVVVGINRVASFVAYTKELSAQYAVRIRSFGHAGDGNLHIYVCKDDMPQQRWESTVKEVMDRLYARAAHLGGQVSGEHGIGHAKRDYLRQSVGERQMALMRGIKTAFDPKGILNPGKVIL